MRSPRPKPATAVQPAAAGARKPPRSANRRYCPNGHGRTGRAEAPGVCPRCGQDGVSLAVIRGRAAAKTRARKAAARGRRSAYEAHLNSFLWRRIRELVIARDGGCCVLCAARTRLHVHHLHYKTFGDETGEELATLCEPCHEREHRRRPGKRRAQGPFAAVRTSTSAADLDAEFAARLARET